MATKTEIRRPDGYHKIYLGNKSPDEMVRQAKRRLVLAGIKSTLGKPLRWLAGSNQTQQ